MEGLAGTSLVQSSDPTSVFSLSGVVRGPVAFAVVLVVGAGFLWRYDTLVERSIDASIERPLAALGYGIAAHLAVLFFAFYAVSQLRLVTWSGRSLAGVGLAAGLVFLLVVAALGFTVVGAAVVEFGWGRHRWSGLFLGATTAGVAALAEPLVGVVVWVVVVSTGIGGPVRTWFNAAEDVRSHR